MNVQGTSATAMKMPIVITPKGRIIALATMDTKEMASTALVIT